jgi:hypothetical protein
MACEDTDGNREFPRLETPSLNISMWNEQQHRDRV